MNNSASNTMSVTINRIQRLYEYNDWAWQRVFPSLAQLDDAEYKRERGFCWGSLHSLMVHAMAAEYVWHQRIIGHSPNAMLAPADYANFATVQSRWEQVDREFRQVVANLADSDLDRLVHYTNTHGQPHSANLGDILLNVINHAT